MHKHLKLILLLLNLLLAAAITFGCLALEFYDAFPNSHQLFVFRHSWYAHLELHTNHWRYEAGAEMPVYISSRGANTVDIYLYDILQTDTLLAQYGLAVRPQAVHDSVSERGTGWQPLASVPIPAGAPSGWYVLEAKSSQKRAACSIFILPDTIRKPVAMLLSTNTWNAYNFWGGKSLYTRNKSQHVSFDRPQLLSDPFLEHRFAYHQLYYQSARKDRHVARWLHAHQLGFDAYPMTELHESIQRLKQYPLLIISTHSEYWTRDMLLHLNAYLDQGGSLLCLSGNTAAYRSYLEQRGRRLTVYKKQQNLWLHADTMHLKPFGTENNLTSFHTYAPYRILVDTSWVLAGTGLKKGDLIGRKSETYDYTYMYSSWLKNLLSALRNHDKWGAASGLEVDQVGPFTPANWVTVARGLNPDTVGHGEVYPESQNWNSQGGADMGYYHHEGGGWVFNVSSLAFTGVIPHDTTIQLILDNVLRQVLK